MPTIRAPARSTRWSCLFFEGRDERKVLSPPSWKAGCLAARCPAPCARPPPFAGRAFRAFATRAGFAPRPSVRAGSGRRATREWSRRAGGQGRSRGGRRRVGELWVAIGGVFAGVFVDQNAREEEPRQRDPGVVAQGRIKTLLVAKVAFAGGEFAGRKAGSRSDRPLVRGKPQPICDVDPSTVEVDVEDQRLECLQADPGAEWRPTRHPAQNPNRRRRE